MSAGVYQLLNCQNGKSYIGSSCELEKRKSQHICDLRTGRHFNHRLQSAYDLYGEDAFEYIILYKAE